MPLGGVVKSSLALNQEGIHVVTHLRSHLIGHRPARALAAT